MMARVQVDIKHGLAVDSLNDLLQNGEAGRCFNDLSLFFSVPLYLDLNYEKNAIILADIGMIIQSRTTRVSFSFLPGYVHFKCHAYLFLSGKCHRFHLDANLSSVPRLCGVCTQL